MTAEWKQCPNESANLQKICTINSCFRPGRDPWEAECMTCKAGTYVSVANKGASDLEAHFSSAKHKVSAKGESSSGKLKDYFLRPDKIITLLHFTWPFKIIVIVNEGTLMASNILF